MDQVVSISQIEGSDQWINSAFHRSRAQMNGSTLLFTDRGLRSMDQVVSISYGNYKPGMILENQANYPHKIMCFQHFNQ